MDALPTGSILAFAGQGLPDGYQWCQGQLVSSKDPIYSALYGVIGTAHGGDGAPNFNLPDYRGRFLRGVDHVKGLDPDSGQRSTPQPSSGNGGNQIGSVQGDAFAAHSHSFVGQHLEASSGGGFDGHGFDSNSSQGPQTYTMSTSGGSTESRPKNAYVEFLIKL